jgi:hypothetical protein
VKLTRGIYEITNPLFETRNVACGRGVFVDRCIGAVDRKRQASDHLRDSAIDADDAVDTVHRQRYELRSAVELPGVGAAAVHDHTTRRVAIDAFDI